MKRMMILAAALCLCAGVAAAQEQTFAQGTNLAGIGVGFGGNLYSGVTSGSGIKKIPAFTAFYERSVKDNLFDAKSALGVGGVIGYSQAKYDDNVWGFGWKSTSFIIGVRGSLHYALVNKLDTYTTLTLGYNVVSWKWTNNAGGLLGNGSASSGFTWTWCVGGRYYFTEKLAAMLELGYGFSILNIGVAYKF